jgi:hypothetical protein
MSIPKLTPNLVILCQERFLPLQHAEVPASDGRIPVEEHIPHSGHVRQADLLNENDWPQRPDVLVAKLGRRSRHGRQQENCVSGTPVSTCEICDECATRCHSTYMSLSKLKNPEASREGVARSCRPEQPLPLCEVDEPEMEFDCGM